MDGVIPVGTNSVHALVQHLNQNLRPELGRGPTPPDAPGGVYAQDGRGLKDSLNDKQIQSGVQKMGNPLLGIVLDVLA